MESKLFKKLFSMLLVVAMVLSMCPTVVFADSTEPEAQSAPVLDADGNGCPHCEGEIEWITFDKATHLDANRNFIAGGHYKLGAALSLQAATSYQPGTTTADATVSTADMIIPEGMDVCFDLNGYTVSVTNIKTCTASTAGRYSRAFTNAGTLSILDSSEAQTGTIKGGAIGARIGNSQAYGGNVYNTGTFNLYGGTISGGYAYARVYNAGALGGNVANGAGSTFNMYGGTITGGTVNSASFNYDTDEKKSHQGGGNLYSAGTVNIYGGTISSGTVGGSYSRSSSGSYNIYSKGGNIFMHTGTFNMYGGTVTGGKISRSFTFKTTDNKAKAGGYGSGGNIYTTNTDVSISNATITGGTIAISIKGESETTSSYAAAAYAYGGNIYIDGDDAKTKVTITDSVISGGVCNAAAAYADTTVTTNRGKGLYINNYGGNIYLTQVARTTIDGNTTISDGVCHGAPTTSDKTHAGGGGNLFCNRILDIKGNTVISGGSGTESAGGSVYLGNYSSCTISENAKVINGVGNENSGGGNIYITGANAYLTVKDDAEVSGGSARGGGNIYANSSAHVTIAGGTVKDGIATWDGEEAYWGGGNILSFNSATVTITGGVISGGTANKFFNSVGIRSKATLNILGGQILGTEAENDLPLIGELSPDDGYGVSIYNGTIAEDPSAFLAPCACYEMGDNGEYKVWHVGVNSELVSCTKSNCAYTANTVEVDPDNTPDAADKHEYSEDGYCTICGVQAIARVNFTDGTIKHYSSIIPALQAANGTGATVTAIRKTETKWYTYFDTYAKRLQNVTLATENGVQMYDTSLNSGQKVYMEDVTFASGIDYKMTGYLYTYGTVNIYGTAFINMMTVYGTVNIYGNQGAQLTTNRNTWISTKCAINIYGGNDDELDWNANILDSGSYSLTIEGTGKLYMENAKTSFAGVDLDSSGSATLEMVNSSLEIRNEGSSFTDVYSMTIYGNGDVIMKGASSLSLKGSVNIGENAKVTMSADSTFKTTTADFQNIKIVAAEGVDGCIYYTEGVYAAAEHKFGEYTSNGDATCTADGTKSATCSNCQAKDTVIDAGTKLDHTYGDWQQHNAAQHKKVCACGDTVYADHNNGTDRICDDCGFESACSHQWGNAVVTKPTCTEDGYTTETCGLCGETRQIDDTEATGHTLEAKDGKAADCLNPGYEAYWQCAECELYFADAEGLVAIADLAAWMAEGGDGFIAKLGHNLIPHDAKAPTCNEIGWDAYDTCSRCDYSTYVEQSPTGNHTPGEAVTENQQAANCGVAGSYDTVTYCTVCEKELSRVTTPVPATGDHNYVLDAQSEKFVCSVCQNEKDAVWCDACESYELWTAWNGKKFTASGHYYLAGDLDLTAEITVEAGLEICLDLNGKTLTAAEGQRGFQVKGTLNILDSGYNAVLNEQTGEITGEHGRIVGSTLGAKGGGIAYVNPGELNLYAGVLYGATLQQGGCIQVSTGKVNLYGGILYKGTASTRYGGNLYVDRSTVLIDGTIIYGGTATDQGGNVYLSTSSTVTLKSGKILNGVSTARPGGNVAVNSGSTFIMVGGEIAGGYGVTGGTTTPTGCNIAPTNAQSVVNIYGGTIGQSKDNAGASITKVNGTINIYNVTTAENPAAFVADCSDYCSIDGVYKVWHTAADVHSEKILNANADCHDWADATCTAPKTCPKCGQTVGKANGHDYKADVTEPDCVNGGYTTYTCHCGDSYIDDYTEATGHDWWKSYDDKYLYSDATCEAAAVYYYSCSVCGEKSTETFVCGEPAGHFYLYASNGDNATHTITCENCDYTGIGDCVDSDGDNACQKCDALLAVYVAENNFGEKFESFEEALAQGGLITLLADIELTSRVSPKLGDVGIQLNGFNITGNVDDPYGMIYIKKDTDLHFYGEGTVQNFGGIAIGVYGHTMIHEGVTVLGEETENAGIYNFYFAPDYYGSANIGGGYVNIIWNCGQLNLQSGQVGFIDNSGRAYYNGGQIGELYAQDGSDCPGLAEAGYIYTRDTSFITVPEDYKLVKVMDGEILYKVVACEYVAEANGVKYESFEEALAAGGAVNLLKDIELTERTTVAVDTVLDLNGFAITGNFTDAFAMLYVKKGATLTVKNGLIENTADVAIGNYGKVIIEASATVNGEGAGLYNFYYQADYYGEAVVNGKVNSIWNSGKLTINASAQVAYLDNSGYTEATGYIAELYLGSGEDAPAVPNAGLVKGDIAGKFELAGGTFETSKYVMIGATEGKYISTDAIFTIAPNATLDMVIVSGTITLNEDLWYTGEGQTLEIAKDATFVIPAGKTLYVNGSNVVVNGTAANFGTLILANGAHLVGDVAGTFQMAGGTFETSKYVMIGATEGKYLSTDAIFTIAPNATMDMTVVSGTITLNDADWWTLAGQTLTIAKDAKFVVPAGKNINVQGTVIVEGTAVTEGTVTLYNENATVKAAAGLNVVAKAGICAVYIDGVYSVHTAHNYAEVTYTDPTTQADGFWTYTCICGDSYTVIDENTRLHVNVPTVDAEDIKDNVETEDTEATTEEIQDVIDHVVHGNEAVVDKDIFVDDANNAVIEQMKNENPALADKEPVLHITLQGMGVKKEAGVLVAHKLVFDVTPMLGDQKIENLAAPLTFHLPVDDSLSGNVYVYHEGEFMGVYEIVSEGGHNYVIVSSQNFSAFTVEVQNANDVAVNMTTGETYESVQAAISAAAKGETVKLVADVNAQSVYIGAGKTLDLNGYKLTVTDFISASFTTSHIVDSSNGTGLLIVDGADVALNSKNKQLPLWTAEGVRFVTVTFGQALDFKDATGAANENVAYYRFAFEEKAAQTILDNVLANGSDGTGLVIRVKVDYTVAGGMKASQYFEYTSDMVKRYVNEKKGWDNNMFTLYLSGVEGLVDLNFSAEIVSTSPSNSSVVLGSTPISE